MNKHGGYGWYVSLNKIVLTSATDRAMVARAHATQGRMLTLLGQYDEADAHLRRATEATAELDHAQLTASLCEFWGQLHHERARQQQTTNVGPAVDALTEALRIDRQIDDQRAAHIHARKLADVYITGGQLAAAWSLLTDAATSRFAHGRNLARVQMVRARAALAGGDPASAYGWLTNARSLLDATRTTQYNREMDELTATAATMTGQFELARNIWTRLASEAHFTGHPRMRAYLIELERLGHR